MAGAFEGDCAGHGTRRYTSSIPITAPYAEYFLKTLRANRSASGIEAIATPVHDKTELESVVADFARQPDGGLVVLPDLLVHHHCQSRGR